MREKRIEEIVNCAASLSTEIMRLNDFFSEKFIDDDGKSFDISHNIFQRDSSTAEAIARVNAVVGIVAEFDKSTRSDLVPIRYLDDLLGAFTGSLEKTKSLYTELNQFIDSRGDLKSFDYKNFHGMANNNENVDLASPFLHFLIPLKIYL